MLCSHSHSLKSSRCHASYRWASFSLPSPAKSSVSFQGLEVRSAVTSAPNEAPVLQLSSSEELDVVSIETGDTGDTGATSYHTPAFEELVEVVTHA